MDKNIWGGSTEYQIQSAYYAEDAQKYSQYVTTLGVSGIAEGLPTATENVSMILPLANTMYTITAANTWKSAEIYNNMDDCILYVDMSNTLATPAALSANGMVVRSLTYYSFNQIFVSPVFHVMADTVNCDIRICGHY